MSQKSIFGLPCSEAAQICDKTAYEESGFLEKLQLKIHLYFCKNCTQYNQKNKRLNELFSKANLQSCSKKEKEVLKERMQNNILDRPDQK